MQQFGHCREMEQQKISIRLCNIYNLKNIKHCPCWYTVISTRSSGNWKNEKCVWKHDAHRDAKVFTKF